MINSNQPGETTPMGAKVTTCGLMQCLDESARLLGWKDSHGQGRSKKRGVGVASLVHVGGSGRIYRSDGGGVILKLDDYGNVNVSYGGVEMGQGLHSALTLTVADAVGVRPDKVFINPTDTATCPWDVGTHASRGAFVGCNAALMAAKKVRDKLFACATEIYPREVQKNLERYQRAHPGYLPPAGFDVALAARPDRFELRDGVLSLNGDVPDEPWLRLELGRLLRAMHFRGSAGQMVVAEAFYEPPSELPDWEKGVGNMSATYTYGVQAVEVEVDEETGEVAILRAVSVHDVGKVLNRQTLMGQVIGGFAQGVGFALYEQVLTERGRILNPSFTDYKIPTIAEMDFPLEVAFIETDDDAGPFGAKGVGEPGLVPTAPAIANAIYDAIGVRMRHLPMTPERVLAAIDERDRCR